MTTWKPVATQLPATTTERERQWNHPTTLPPPPLPTWAVRNPPSSKSFFDLPNADSELEMMAPRAGQDSLFQSPEDEDEDADADDVFEALNGTEWQLEVADISGMLKMASQMLGMDELEESEWNAANAKVDNDRSNWVSLSYLSLGLFLLNQIDALLKLQTETAADNATNETGRSLHPSASLSDSQPWRYNRLNVLLADPSEFNAGSADSPSEDVKMIIERVTDNDRDTHFDVNNYARLALNLIKVSHANESIDCLWHAYCSELNNRAPLDGVVGAVARWNGVLLRLMAGQLSAYSSINQFIETLGRFHDLQCGDLFPT